MKLQQEQSRATQNGSDQKTVSGATDRAITVPERMTMQTRIRIVKRGEGGNTRDPSPNHVESTPPQTEREMAKTVKSWIAEWEARNRAVKAAAFSLLRSLETGSENSTRRLAVVNR
jgi:hypothetical protein